MAYEVSAMPTFKAFRDRQEVGALRGASLDALRELVEQHAGRKPVARDLAAERASRQAAQREALVALLAEPDKERVRTALTTLIKIAGNILTDPSEPKYRSLKVDNKAIKEKVLACPGGRSMLLSVGFEPQVEKYECYSAAAVPGDLNGTSRPPHVCPHTTVRSKLARSHDRSCSCCRPMRS